MPNQLQKGGRGIAPTNSQPPR